MSLVNPDISIVIPTYIQRGEGPQFFRELLNSIKGQAYAGRYEICVSDNDDTGVFADICDYYRMLPIRYNHNPIRGASENINAAIDMARADKVKIMCMDDLFNKPNALQLFSDALDTHGWAVSGSTVINKYAMRIKPARAFFEPDKLDKNMTGMPSCVAFRRTSARFDSSLKTFCDLDFYQQLYREFGDPYKIISPAVCQRYHDASQSRNQPGTHQEESIILKQRYANTH